MSQPSLNGEPTSSQSTLAHLQSDSINTPSNAKGKARAFPSERTPLLQSDSEASSRPSRRSRSDSTRRTTSSNRRHSLCSRLLTIFLLFLCFSLLSLLLFVLLLYSYASTASRLPPSTIAAHAVVLRPRGANVLNASAEDGVWVRVEMDIGLDADWVLGFRARDEDVPFMERAWRAVGRWGVRKVRSVTVEMDTVYVFPEWSTSQEPMVSLSIPPFAVPLTAGAPRKGYAPEEDRDLSWLTPLSLTVCAHPTEDQAQIEQFVERSWRSGRISLRAEVKEVGVSAGDEVSKGWRSWVKVTREDVMAIFRYNIPPLPGLPTPGTGEPFPPIASFLKLQSYSLTPSTDPSDTAPRIMATASLPNPLLRSLSLTLPRIPVHVSLISAESNSSAPIAAVVATPHFRRTNITVSLNGIILPLEHNSVPLLSAFISNFLSALPSPILLGSPLFPTLQIEALFPAPPYRPRVLRDVQIRNMRLSGLSDGKALASGEVWAKVVFPKGVDLDLDVRRLWPDVLVYDGEVPHSNDLREKAFPRFPPNGPTHFPWPWPFPKFPHHRNGTPPVTPPGSHTRKPTPIPPNPLPSPLPKGAFARIRPDDWLNAEFVDDDVEPSWGWGGELDWNADEDGKSKTVFAKIVDVPLEVLPGRDAQFRSFVSKVVFSKQGALAGVQGTTAIGVTIPGLLQTEFNVVTQDDDGDDDQPVLELTGLPFEGKVRIGKHSLRGLEWTP